MYNVHGEQSLRREGQKENKDLFFKLRRLQLWFGWELSSCDRVHEIQPDIKAEHWYYHPYKLWFFLLIYWLVSQNIYWPCMLMQHSVLHSGIVVSLWPSQYPGIKIKSIDNLSNQTSESTRSHLLKLSKAYYLFSKCIQIRRWPRWLSCKSL